VKLQQEMANAFGLIAQRRGVPAATLACLVLGEYVEKMEEQGKLQRLVALDASKRFSETLTEERVDKLLTQAFSPDAMAGVLSALQHAETVAAGQAGSSTGPEAAAHLGAQPLDGTG
jgi:hypothetical protein